MLTFFATVDKAAPLSPNHFQVLTLYVLLGHWNQKAIEWCMHVIDSCYSIQLITKCFSHFRDKSHSHVVKLLKGSGSRPSLLVQWRPASALKHQSSMTSIPSSSRSSQLSVTFENERPATVSRCSSMASKPYSIRSDLFLNGTGFSRNDLRMLGRQFKIQVQSYVKGP